MNSPEAQARYDKSEKGRATRKRWMASPEGKASQASRTERYWRKRLGVDTAQDICAEFLQNNSDLALQDSPDGEAARKASAFVHRIMTAMKDPP